MSIANSSAMVKFYFLRFDPSFSGDRTSSTQAIAQVAMPMDGFAAMVTFFDNALKGYIAQGLITEDRVNELRNLQADA